MTTIMISLLQSALSTGSAKNVILWQRQGFHHRDTETQRSHRDFDALLCATFVSCGVSVVNLYLESCSITFSHYPSIFQNLISAQRRAVMPTDSSVTRCFCR